MSTHSKIQSGLGARRDQTYQEDEHDTSKLQGKLKAPTVWPTCRAVFHKGRWTWEAKPAGAHETLCPACLRITINTPRVSSRSRDRSEDTQHEQLIGVVKNMEEKENTRSPGSWGLNHDLRAWSFRRPIPICPRRIGDALKQAYHGELELHYDQDEQFVRVTWTN